MRYLALLIISGCAYHPAPPYPSLDPGPVPAGSVLPYTDGYSLCSSVVTKRGEVTVAAHCRRDIPKGVVVLWDGTTLPVLSTSPGERPDELKLRVADRLPFPVARGVGRVAYVVGYGCRSTEEWFLLREDVHRVEGPLEPADFCHGDSGGGLFNAAGELVGIAVYR